MKNPDLNLAQSTKTTFCDYAPIYLKIDKRWGCDLDIIAKAAEKFKNPEVLDLGVGHAWHLANLFFLTSINIKKAVGIDYSSEMLAQAKKLLASIVYDGQQLARRIALKKADILSLPFPKDSFDLALFMNNTLGNIPGGGFKQANQERIKALTEARRVLKKSGILILSVYNSSRFTRNEYKHPLGILWEASSPDSFDFVGRFTGTNSFFYTHWFNRKELEELLTNLDFKILKVEKRGKRIIAVAQKL